ncbi:hypothetical protein BRYFOR_05592 [Marvinbryantia formatexigens DSM 14469]|uniref:Uncharacterized protein n=3 Tax=Marvinbryantia TaxID=248744 RepID=C6LAF0_9FIRM|nr:hypothetical protein BRYFOR_05592 [Marvinbryantia formatexigens DSM 14469]SDG62145.1 hypothetical protein SAMN05660368_02933 [Marvinbryantia formatexigens]
MAWFLSSVMDISKMTTWMKDLYVLIADLPAWAKTIIALLIVAYLFYKKKLKHKEKMKNMQLKRDIRRQKEITKRTKIIAESLTKMNESNNQLSKTKTLFGKCNVIDYSDEQRKGLAKKFDAKMMDTINDEIEEIFSKESTPVCKDEKAKQINFPKNKKKRSK